MHRTKEIRDECATDRYQDWLRKHGFKHWEVLDWTSSAGDWQFIASKDGKTWYLFWQENNYPRRGGFTRVVETKPFHGTKEAVLKEAWDWYCR